MLNDEMLEVFSLKLGMKLEWNILTLQSFTGDPVQPNEARKKRLEERETTIICKRYHCVHRNTKYR